MLAHPEPYPVYYDIGLTKSDPGDPRLSQALVLTGTVRCTPTWKREYAVVLTRARYS